MRISSPWLAHLPTDDQEVFIRNLQGKSLVTLIIINMIVLMMTMMIIKMVTRTVMMTMTKLVKL